jgi:uncharacterized protein YccT (UPF0319 family)
MIYLSLNSHYLTFLKIPKKNNQYQIIERNGHTMVSKQQQLINNNLIDIHHLTLRYFNQNSSGIKPSLNQLMMPLINMILAISKP